MATNNPSTGSMPPPPQAAQSPHAHLIESLWDYQFLSEPSYEAWFRGQIKIAPMQPNQKLVEYVRERVLANQQKKSQSQSPAPSTGTAETQAPRATSAPVAQTNAVQSKPTPLPAPAAAPAQQSLPSRTLGNPQAAQASLAPTTAASAPAGASSQAPSWTSTPAESKSAPSGSNGQDMVDSYFHMDSYPNDKSSNGSPYNAGSAFQSSAPPTMAPDATQTGYPNGYDNGSYLNSAHQYGSPSPYPRPAPHTFQATTAYLNQSHHPYSSSYSSSAPPASMSAYNNGVVDPSLVSPHQSQPAPQQQASFQPKYQLVPPQWQQQQLQQQQQPRPQAVSMQAINPAQLAGHQPAQFQQQLGMSSGPVASTSAAPPLPAVASSPKPPAPPMKPELRRWHAVHNSLLDIIDDDRFPRARNRAAAKLSRLLADFKTPASSSAPEGEQPVQSQQSAWGDESDVPPAGRVLVLKAMLKHGDDDFWRAWFKEVEGMDALMRWFAGAARSQKKDDKISKEDRKLLDSSLVLLLEVFCRLPFTRATLSQEYRIGARMKRLEGSKNAELAKLAKKLVKHWQTFRDGVPAVGAATMTTGSSSAASSVSKAVKAEPVAAKRKTIAPAEGPNKKVKPSPAAATTAATTAATSGPAAATSATAAASKPASVNIGALRSFKKAGVVKGGAPSSAGAAPDVFTSLLESLDKKNPGLAALAPIDPTSKLQTSLGAKKEKQKKSVRWVDGEDLVKIRFFEVEGDDDDESMGERVHDVKMMDEQEGVTLTMHLEKDMEEDIDWYDDIPGVVVPDAEEFKPYLEGSEVTTPAVQAEDARLSGVVLPTPDDAPTPGSPLPASVSNDFKTTTMMLSNELRDDVEVQTAIARAQASGPPVFGEGVGNEELANLLSQLGPQGAANLSALAGTNGIGSSASQSQAQTFLPPGVSALSAATNAAATSSTPAIAPDQLASLAASLNPAAIASLSQHLKLPGGSTQSTAAPFGAQAGWPGAAGAWPGSSAGFGGAAQSMPSPPKRKKCKFFNMGGCDRGNRCQLMHDRGNGRDVRE